MAGGEPTEKHGESFEIAGKDLRIGLYVLKFLDVPPFFQLPDAAKIELLIETNPVLVNIVRDGFDETVKPIDLLMYDKITKIHNLEEPYLLKTQEQVDKFRVVGFKKVMVAEPVVEAPKPHGLDKLESFKLKEKAVEDLQKLQEDMAESDKKIDEGYQIVHDVMQLKTVTMDDLHSVKKFAEWQVKSMKKNPDASVVLSTLKDHDEYTYHHCIDVANQNLVVCEFMGQTNQKLLEEISLGGLLHDIGKSKIPTSLINKPGPLDDKEWGYMRKHPELGAQILSDLSFSKKAIDIVHYHHVKKNGKGYPNVPYDGVSKMGRLTSISDVYQALVTHRPYKKTDPPNVALSRIKSWAAEDFDDRLVDVFIKSFGVYPVGSLVELSDHTKAFVVSKGENTSRPFLALVLDSGDQRLAHQEFINLADPEHKNLKILRALNHRDYFEDASELFMNINMR